MDPDTTLSETGSPLDDESPPAAVASPTRRGVTVGRYLLLDARGTGRGGTVYTAWDPQLDRKLAVRLVTVADEGEREPLMRGVQALAKLSHPNVVTIHDVGDQGDHVWIAMDLVTGPTLDAWARERPRRTAERVRMLTDVARGVAAAHAAGLVHGSLEPIRARVDDDGRVRVTTFVVAPDRDPAEDQLAWSAMARALRDQADEPHAHRMPRWLRRIVDRAGAPEPAQRWPTMAALVDALERGRARARARLAAALLAGVALLGAGVEAQRRWELAQRTAACEDAGAAMDAVWSDAARQRLRDAFAATGVSFAATTAEKVMPWLDARAREWTQARTEACLATEVRGTWSPETYDRATWCLEELQMSMASLVDELGRADATAVQKAVGAVASPSMSAACIDEDLLLRQPAPPSEGREAIREVREELSRARSLSLAGRYDAALTATTGARERAEGLDWPPLWAAARVLEADLQERTGSFDAALTASAEAFVAAGRAGEWKVAADAAMLADWITGVQLTRTAEGRVWSEHAALAIARAGDPTGLQESSRLQNLGNGYRIDGDLGKARALLERALAIVEAQLGPDHPNVASCLNNLAVVHGSANEPEAARALYERALAIREQALGPDHPDVASSLTNLATTSVSLGELDAARALYERALAIRERALSPDHPDVATTLAGLTAVEAMTGRLAEAQVLAERALAIRERALGPAHPAVAISLNNLAHVVESTGRYAEAMALHERSLAIFEAALGPMHPNLVSSLTGLAKLHLVLGEPEKAQALEERARIIRAGAPGAG